GYAWSWTREKVSNSDIIYTHGSDTCYCVCTYGKYIYHCDIKDAEGLITEFADLIEPDDYGVDITDGKIRYGGNLSQLNNLIDDSPIDS
ncbi:MAG: hypothetical protein LUE92_10245, partial [Clostridiales bacterium]|nr:hypothetical protein [Clostridiales bacterium]